MELTYLRTFQAVAVWGSYTMAAEKLGYAQSSVTAQMAKLEELYGVTLLERAGKGMRLTFEGRALLKYADRILALRDEAYAAVSGKREGELRIASIETLASCFLPYRLHGFRSAHPDVLLRIQPGSEPDIIAAVKAGTADFGLIFDQPFHSDELECRTLRRERLYVVLPPGHRLADRNGLSPNDLKGIPLVLTEESCTYRAYLMGRFREAGVDPAIEMELGHLEGIKKAVLHGWGAAFLPAYAVEEELTAGSLRALPLEQDRADFRIQLIWRKGRHLSALYKEFAYALNL